MAKAPEIKLRPKKAELPPQIEKEVSLESKSEVEPRAPEMSAKSEKVEWSTPATEQPTRVPRQTQHVPEPKNEILQRVESILSEDLADTYRSLNPEKQKAFKKKGEEVALKVQEMVEKGHLRIRKVLKWIREWLRIIPGVNSFFLEQEAKIKADKLLEYYKEHTGR